MLSSAGCNPMSKGLDYLNQDSSVTYWAYLEEASYQKGYDNFDQDRYVPSIFIFFGLCYTGFNF